MSQNRVMRNSNVITKSNKQPTISLYTDVATSIGEGKLSNKTSSILLTNSSCHILILAIRLCVCLYKKRGFMVLTSSLGVHWLLNAWNPRSQTVPCALIYIHCNCNPMKTAPHSEIFIRAIHLNALNNIAICNLIIIF